jgi:hypothetical protein
MSRVGIEPPLAIEFGKELIKNGVKLNLEKIRDVNTLSSEIINSMKGGINNE